VVLSELSELTEFGGLGIHGDLVCLSTTFKYQEIGFQLEPGSPKRPIDRKMAVIPAAARAVYSPPLLNEKQQKTEKLSFLVFHGVSCAFICFHMFSLFFSMWVISNWRSCVIAVARRSCH
jgi:hypothetical protein